MIVGVPREIKDFEGRVGEPSRARADGAAADVGDAGGDVVVSGNRADRMGSRDPLN